MTRHISSRINTSLSSSGDDLRSAQEELLARFEQHEPKPLAEVLRRHPGLLAELTDFYAGLVATSHTDMATAIAETDQIAARAAAKAFAIVYPAATTTGATLKAARQERHVTLRAFAATLGIGVDVLSYLEAGLIRAASVPDRLIQAWSDALSVSTGEIKALLAHQVAHVPALQRNPWGSTADSARTSIVDFADAIRNSPNMTEDEKAHWLAG